jgi:hypothetical protein
MLINPVSQADAAKVVSHTTSTNTAQAAAQPVATNKKPSAVKPRLVTDTVNVSGAAMAAVQEATETAAVTAKEARSGDRQAQRLLAKQVAAEEVDESPVSMRVEGKFE